MQTIIYVNVTITDWLLEMVLKTELKELNLAKVQTETKAKNRSGWRSLVLTLFYTGSEDDR